MCKRCESYFTVHNVKELMRYLSLYGGSKIQKEEVLKLWRERGYLSNLIYLEYLYETNLESR